MKWYYYIICFVLIFVGIFSTIELLKIFNIKSAEYGTVITIETKNNYIEISKFDYGSLSFDTEDYINFTNISTFAPSDFDGKSNDYTILFNGQPVSNVVVNAGKISGNLIMYFRDLNGEIVSTSDLYILIEYYASCTKVTLSMVNMNDGIAYFTTYTNINGAIIKVVQRRET